MHLQDDDDAHDVTQAAIAAAEKMGLDCLSGKRTLQQMNIGAAAVGIVSGESLMTILITTKAMKSFDLLSGDRAHSIMMLGPVQGGYSTPKP